MENKVFESVSRENIKYSAFDLSHEKKLSCQMGQLIPVLLQEIVPGDMFRVTTEVMLGLSPTLAPIMHRINIFVHHFFVANRLVWDDWEDFITGGDDGTSSPAMPQVSGTSNSYWGEGRLPDYFGINPSTAAIVTDYSFVSQLPFRGYHLIWSEYYRDQLLQTKYDPIEGTPWTESAQTALKLRGWEKDYFTSALPSPQKGSAITAAITASTTGALQSVDLIADPGPNTTNDVLQSDNSTGTKVVGATSGDTYTFDPYSSFTTTGTVDINALRSAVRFQEWWEIAARGGSRYVEQLRNHFGVQPDDLRHARPKYLGGGRTPLQISEVVNTSGAGSDPL